MALVLGLIGIYGVISYSVSQRTREIGIRMALGAQQPALTGMFVRHSLLLAAIGLGRGLAVAFVLRCGMASLLFGISPEDPITYAAVAAGLAVARGAGELSAFAPCDAGGSCGGPARGIARPMRGILFDMDGVLYNSDQLIPGSPETIAWVREQRIPHLFVTNTTSCPRLALVAKLERFGMAASEEAIFTPAAAASDWLRQNGSGPATLFLRPATRSEFAGLPCLDDNAERGASGVVIGDMATYGIPGRSIARSACSITTRTPC